MPDYPPLSDLDPQPPPEQVPVPSTSQWLESKLRALIGAPSHYLNPFPQDPLAALRQPRQDPPPGLSPKARGIQELLDPEKREQAIDLGLSFTPGGIETATGPLQALKEAQFSHWFGKSKAVDEKGLPIVAYRGEYGKSAENEAFHSRLPSLSFGDPETASLYAMDPNNAADRLYRPRVTPVHLKIENPIIENRSDPFVDMGELADKLGIKEARRIANKFSSDIQNTGNWDETFSGKYDSVKDLLKAEPDQLKNLYFESYRLLDDPAEVELMKRKGYDGAIHVGTGDNASEIEYRIFDPSQAASAIKPYRGPQQALAESYGPVGTHPDENALNVNSILHKDTPAQPPASQNVEDIAQALHERGSAALRNLGVENGIIDYSTATPHQSELVARAMAAEIKGAIERGGKTAINWYTGAIDEALQHAESLHPELRNNPIQKMGFTASLAVTSQGERVASNVRLAEQAYDVFKRTGRFPTNIVAEAGEQMNGNFAKLNQLLDDLGPQGLHDFLHRDYTARELKQAGFAVDENMDTKLKGSAILGSKIGQGFFQNLNGNFNPVTMDLWFMRAIGRLTGTLVGRAPVMEKATERLQSAMRKAGYNQIPENPAELRQAADEIMRRHERDYSANRTAYKSGELKKSELTFAAERYQKNQSGINEQPLSGGHRQWLRGVVNRARDILASAGHNLTNADLQAIWWYPEKDLYSKLGGRDSEAINTDYATVYRELAGRAAQLRTAP